MWQLAEVFSIQITFLRINPVDVFSRKKDFRQIKCPGKFLQNTVWSSNQFSKDFWVRLGLLENLCVVPRTVFLPSELLPSFHSEQGTCNLHDLDITYFQVKEFCIFFLVFLGFMLLQKLAHSYQRYCCNESPYLAFKCSRKMLSRHLQVKTISKRTYVYKYYYFCSESTWIDSKYLLFVSSTLCTCT